MSARVNALDIPLSGVRLVEAGAGTGKTFTIATLYLRLILERGLLPEKIVVGTFTRAATAELATRLRKRLRLAAELLRRPDPARDRDDDDGDAQVTRAVIRKLLDAGDTDVNTLADRARKAELSMDTAVIGTLHGFCNRILGEFGFQTGRVPGEQELLEDARALQRETIEDFWRACSASADDARVLSETWKTPDALAGQATDPRWRGREIIAGESLRMSAAQAHAQRGELFAQLDAIRNSIAGWDGSALQTAGAELGECFDKRGWSARDSRIRGLQHLHAWAKTGGAANLLSNKARKAIADLAEDTLTGLASCKRAPRGPVFAAIADLGAGLARLEQLDATAAAHLLLKARAFLQRELPKRMQALGKLGHDQVMDELADALHDPVRGARAIRAIRARWPVALVDEFQDTDPQQWRILKTLFAHEDGTLVLVGDPKQAIYGFRGGDVHAWLMAKAEAQGASLQLDESQRAGVGVNAAINALFSRPHAFVENGIDHPDVRSAERVQQRALLVDGEPAPGLQCWRLPATGIRNKDGSARACYKGDAQAAIESACVAQIVEWLEAARAGRVLLREGDGDPRALRASDIAVLVNSNREAKSMQRALAHAGVPAASCLRASVYASEEAVDLRLVLEALRDPTDPRRARAARASVLLGADAVTLECSNQSDVALDNLLQESADWTARIERRGPLPLLHELIARAAPRLLALPGGDRRVANYLQLAELLQNASTLCFSVDDLCEEYSRALSKSTADTDADAVRLRLDTDAQAVQIATVHAAKGLEYSVVFLPEAISGFANDRKKGGLPLLTWYHDGDRACVAVGDEVAEDAVLHAQDEWLAEEVRKFYVGATRARAACVIPWGWVRQGEHTAAHWLLHETGRDTALKFDENGCEQALSDLVARGNGHICVRALPAANSKRLTKQLAEAQQFAAAIFHAEIERDWSTWSFTRLVRGETRRGSADPVPGSGDETSLIVESPAAFSSSLSPTLSGPRFGSAVHAALEKTGFAAWHDKSTVPESEHALLARCLRAQGLPEAGDISESRAIEIVGKCMSGALNVLLPCGARLCDLPLERRRAELEFHLRLSPMRVDTLFALLHRHGYQRGRTGVGRTTLHGLLTGVIDLVFEHAGRYHLIDYKTNVLADYDVTTLRQAIESHDYDLQYLLYVLALHRWLRAVLPGYDYETHIGEVYYLFVRDLREGRGIHRDRPPRQLIETMDALFDAQTERAA